VKKILVVDDDESNAFVLAKLLQHCGYDAVFELSGEAALKTAAAFEPEQDHRWRGMNELKGDGSGRDSFFWKRRDFRAKRAASPFSQAHRSGTLKELLGDFGRGSRKTIRRIRLSGWPRSRMARMKSGTAVGFDGPQSPAEFTSSRSGP
jgi:hypothetical protein